MSAEAGFRVAVAGATGALGSEVLAVLAARRFPIRRLLPFATDRSLGAAIEFRGEEIPVETGSVSLAGIDLLFLCTPPAAALEIAQQAVTQGVAAFDLSGALVERPEVPLLVAGVHSPPDALRAPLVAMPAGPALAWIRVLAPLAESFGLRRVVGTTLESVAGGGRAGIDALSAESIALFNQEDLPEPGVFGRPVAFDCIPWVGEPQEAEESERGMEAALRRLFGEDFRVAVTRIRVPTFCGDGAVLLVEAAQPVAPEEARELLAKADAVEVWEPAAGPTTRASAGRDAVLVSRVRRDRSSEGSLLLWLAADALRLAAANAVRLAEARQRLG